MFRSEVKVFAISFVISYDKHQFILDWICVKLISDQLLQPQNKPACHKGHQLSRNLNSSKSIF